MSIASIKGTTTVGGLRVADNVDVVAEMAVLAQKSVAYTGATNVWAQLTTRTSDSVGILTWTGTPPVTTGQVVDLYFAAGIRYGVTVGTVTSTTAPFSGGTGDNLPTATTYCLMRLPQVESFSFPQDAAELLLFAAATNFTGDTTTVTYGTGRFTVRLLTAADAEIMKRTVSDGYSWRWTAGSGETDPTAGLVVAKISVSHCYGTASNAQKTIIVGAAYN